MRQLLGKPVGITDEELRTCLTATGWDLGTALRRMNDVLQVARDHHVAGMPNRSLEEQQREQLLGAESLHHNRRLGINIIYSRLVHVVPPHQRELLTTLTLGQLLADHRFDLDEAVDAFFERLLQPEVLRHHLILERRLRMVGPNQLHQDQRIARFTEIAGTADFYAVRGLLAQYGFDLLRVFDHWMRHGLPTQPIPPRELNRSHFRSSRRPHTDREDLWPHPRVVAGRLDSIDEDGLAESELDYGSSGVVREGWFVRYPRMEARVGIQIPTRLIHYYIRRGSWRVVEIRRVGRELFDYNNSRHVAFLNTEVGQRFRRILGEKTKARGELYQADEDDFLWYWHNERLWEIIEAHP